MPQKKSTSIYRKNLVNVGIGQGMLETQPYLFSFTEYDRNGLTLQQSSFTGDGLLSEKIIRVYDDKGRVIGEDYYTGEEAPSERNRYELDSGGLVVREVKNYLDGSTDTTTYTYDENSHLTEKVTLDEEGNRFESAKFAWEDGRMVRHEVFDEDENLVQLEEYAYDKEGRVTMHRRKNEDTGENFRMTSTYNEEGLKVADKLVDEEGELIEIIRFFYDPAGKLIQSVVESDEKNSATNYFYDDRGNPLGWEEVSDEGDQILWVEHTYDASGNLENSVVFANGRGKSMSQHYELRYEYLWYDED